MTIRINVQDLSPPPAERESNVYQLSYHIDDQYYAHPIEEGETQIGSSSFCDISIKAPGVRGRHACLKRHGSKLFIRNSGKGKVRLHGREIEDATPLCVGEPFTIGSVTAVAECILPPDRMAAVQVQPSGITSLLGGADHTASEPATHHLRLLNQWVERMPNGIKPTAGELLSEVLKPFAPISAVLLCRRTDDDWVVLSEMGSDGIRLLEDPSMAKKCSHFRLRIGENDYRMLAQFPDEEDHPWRNEFCRLLLALAAISREYGEPKKPQTIEPPSQTTSPWGRLAGSQIRSHLAGQTELCRHSDHVLIIGETGTGKELAARSLHRLWQRRGEFVAINCAAIPAELLDSELFGVTAGAATGVSARPGRFKQARSGTLFLDEISEMPRPLQGKLLRVLQEREYYPVGGERLEKADVKVVASSNCSEAALRSEYMRPDLYFRLSEAVVVMPPLRERLQDMAELCEQILNRLEQRFGRNVKGLSVAALERMKAFAWPGNVRELQNLLRNLYMTVPPGSLIRSAHLSKPFHAQPETPPGGTLASAVQNVERKVIQQAIDQQNSVKDAAKILGLSEGYLYRKMKKLGLARRKPKNN